MRRVRGRWCIAVIEPNRSEAPSQKPAKPVWALPKGLVDPGEKADQTALREVIEETGVTGELITKLTDIKYFYVRSWGDRQRVFKVVSFYLLRYTSGRIGEITEEMRQEVQQAVWLALDEAPQKLSYKGERDAVALAAAYLEKHPEF